MNTFALRMSQRDFLGGQWFKTAFNAGGVGSISGWEAIPQAVQPKNPHKTEAIL